MTSILGTYELTHSKSFRCGSSVFTAPQGSLVKVKQVDPINRKILIDFGHRLIDWLPDNTLSSMQQIESAF